MKLADALRGIAHLGVDTAPFIYFVERNPTYVAECAEVFRLVDEASLLGYTSVLTLTETLTKPLKANDYLLVQAYRDFLLTTRNLELIDLSTTIALQAADFRSRYNLRTPDAIQIASVLAVGCQAFLTNDRGLMRIREIPILILDDLEL